MKSAKLVVLLAKRNIELDIKGYKERDFAEFDARKEVKSYDSFIKTLK
jgi:hypothetical protein